MVINRINSEYFWTFGVVVACLVIAIPLFSIIIMAFFPKENIWPHLVSSVLPMYSLNTIILMLGNGAGVFIIGTLTAWLVCSFNFPGRSFFEWALLLPLAVPTYIIAFVYTDIFEFAGPVQTLLRSIFGWKNLTEYWFPDIRSIEGAIFVMSFVLYPYVYLLARASFKEQSFSMLEAGKSLGKNTWVVFYKVSLPLARPAIVVGVSLAMMETLADFGTVDFFAVKTLTLAIFNVWLGMGNAGGASQIAVTILCFVIVLISIERIARKGRGYQINTKRHKTPHRLELTQFQKFASFLLCLFPIIVGFLIPALVLFVYAYKLFEVSFKPEFFGYAWNSFFLSIITSIVTIFVAFFLAFGRRFAGKFFSIVSQFVLLGYAVPGAVLAVGVLIPLAKLDNLISDFFLETFGYSTGLIFSGSIFALIFTYTIRFLAIGFGGAESSLSKIPSSFEMAARTLGSKPGKVLRYIHLPLIRSSMFAAAVIVFVDTMKELPATLILRPFNFDTLAINVYQLASDELFEQSALSALTIVLVGIFPVIILSKISIFDSSTDYGPNVNVR